MTLQEVYEAEEILKLKQSSLKKEESDMVSSLQGLEKERNVHIRELKRINNEDQSKHRDYPVLNRR